MPNVELRRSYKGQLSATIELDPQDMPPEGDLMDLFEIEQLVEHFGAGKFLDHIGKKTAADHFGLLDQEEY